MLHRSLLVLGRQPAIGRAELESLFGAAHLEPVGESAMASDLLPEAIAFSRLGSCVRVARTVQAIASDDWRSVQTALAAAATSLAEDVSEGKIQLGISCFGLKVEPRQLLGAGLTIKKSLRSRGYSVRLVPNQEAALSSAQVLHNHLTGERGIELLAVRNGNQVVIARTTASQDINAYAARDQNRPKRDAFVGMLPPKLAQTLVNLAVAGLSPTEDNVVLDPFCGTGVVLQEALLMGFGAYGSDLEPRMVDYSAHNLTWLATQHGTRPDPALEVGDATNHHWQHPVTVVASETYLGHPLSSWPTPPKLQEITGTCNVIIEKFLRNLASQLQSGQRLCLAIPAWRAPNGHVHHLPLLDHLEDMGYNRVSFEHVRSPELLYYRPDQLVARELLVITRK